MRDRFDVDDLGIKTGSGGVVVAGSGPRRVLRNDIGLERPYEFMQGLVQEAGGENITVLNASHMHCGELFVTLGAITEELQLIYRNAARYHWRESLNIMQRLAPSDARLITLVDDYTEPRGSAPVVQFLPGGRMTLVNPDYLTGVIHKYPLTEGFLDRLASDQQNYRVIVNI